MKYYDPCSPSSYKHTRIGEPSLEEPDRDEPELSPEEENLLSLAETPEGQNLEKEDLDEDAMDVPVSSQILRESLMGMLGVKNKEKR